MRVLHLPVKPATHLSTTVRALRAIGVDARGIVALAASSVQTHADVEVLTAVPSRRSPRWWLEMLRASPRLRSSLRWADVVHWHMTAALPGHLDVRWVSALGKPGVVEFSGGDIRIPEIESTDNPFYAARGTDYEYLSMETRENSLRNQRRFARAGMQVLLPCESMAAYLDRGLFPSYHRTRQRVILGDYDPLPPDPAKRRPLVVHAATAPVCKGTETVIAAVERLHGRHDFDFIALDRVPRDEALDAMRRADVYVDQFVIGAHGTAAVEAMAFAKPVVCYIKPSMIDRYPRELPIVNASKHTLEERLDALLSDGQERARLGSRGREYVERYHDALRIAGELRGLYAELLA
jgi:hypothetical protein